MHRSVPPASLLLLGLCAACAGLPVPGLGGDDGVLAYGESSGAAVYAFTDSTSMTIAAGPMGTLRVLSAQSGAVEITMEGDAEGIRGTVRVLDYDGRFENPGQGAIRADEDDIAGAWTVALSPRGRLAVIDTPSVSERGREILGDESFVRPFFVHLPGGRAEPGARWVDTVSVTEQGPETVTRARSIIASALAGDTVVDGRRLLVIRTESSTTLEVEGSSGGVEVLQRMSGASRGTILWDAAEGVLVDREESGELEGTLELPGMGFTGLPVDATVRRTLSLRP